MVTRTSGTGSTWLQQRLGDNFWIIKIFRFRYPPLTLLSVLTLGKSEGSEES